MEDEAGRALSYRMQDAVLNTQSVKKVEELLKAGADLNAAIGCGTYSPLDGAIQTENAALLKFLLAHGAKPRPRHLCDAAFARHTKASLEMVEALLAAGLDPNTPGESRVPLASAVYLGHREVVTLLLAQPGIDINRADSDGYTALMWAAAHGSLELAELLLKAGADPRLKNENGMTAATFADQEVTKRQTITRKLQNGLAGQASR